MTTTAAIRERLYRRHPGIRDEQMLTPQEVAALFAVDIREVYTQIEAGVLPARRRRGKGGRLCNHVRLADARGIWGPT